MTSETVFLLPRAEWFRSPASAPAPRIQGLRGARVGIVSNGWRSLDIMYEELCNALSQNFGVATLVHARKTNRIDPLETNQVEALVAGCDAVVIGLGN